MIVLSPALGFAIFFVGLYGASLGVGNAGLFYTLSAVSMILVRLKSGAFMNRFAPIKILPVALACGLVAFAMLVACGTVLDGTPVCDAVFNLSGIVYGFCTGIALPLNQSVAVKNTPPSDGEPPTRFSSLQSTSASGEPRDLGNRERLLRVPRHHLLARCAASRRRTSSREPFIRRNSRSRTKTFLSGDDLPCPQFVPSSSTARPVPGCSTKRPRPVCFQQQHRAP